MKVNIAIAGGPCTGKSTLAAEVYVHTKIEGLDYDLINEELRRIYSEFGHSRTPFDRFYLWRQQEREELRSVATDGFITDTPLFIFLVQAQEFVEEPRDELAVRELFRMCLDLRHRYQLIALPENPRELPYKTDQVRIAGEEKSVRRHEKIRHLIELNWPEKLLLVSGSLEARTAAIIERLKQLRQMEVQ